MELVERAAHLLAQLGVILLVAKLFGELFERYLKQSAVLGELVGGMLIGPYALGHLIRLPGMQEPLFAIPHGHAGGIPLSPELWGVAQLAAVLLLFGAGLETDFSLFLRFGVPAFVVGMGGVIFPFLFGVVLTVMFGYADNLMHPSALFMGAVMTATSVGITARVLSELGRLGTPEGVTVLAAAVIDDVLGIIVLAIVTSIVQVGQVDALKLGGIAVKAFGFWLVLTGVLVALAPMLAKFLRRFKSEGAFIGLALALCFLIASLTESVGKLAMIIGAYALGLAFSRTELREDLEHALRPLLHGLVPIFFVAMGMLVNFSAMLPAFWFGVAISIAAIITKVFGCGLPALAVGFNALGGARIGLGMMPRGEVALIVAGMGLAYKAINEAEFGVAIMMTFVTTFLAPIALVPLFRNPQSGVRAKEAKVHG
ncbi:MAG: cation:proton antiporter [Armatimonadota bacterium]|jgi:Kef-type K+ transport system membrane component KefB|nr:cation:proton antiporter [Armatimonadota bacterium]MDT7972511.1 cation:proton antiporter [Armatimonadota bacterium]